MTTYTLEYDAIAVNVAPATLSTAMAAQPIPMEMLDTLGLSVTSDVTAVVGRDVTRTIQLTSSTGPLPNNQIRPSLENYMTTQLAQALSTPIVAQPVIVI